MYQPILKGKKAEFDAWRNVQAGKRKNAIPLFELVRKDGLDKDLKAFRDRLIESAQSGDIVAVDFRSLASGSAEPSSGLRPHSWLVRELATYGVRVRPVIYLDYTVETTRDALFA